MPPTPRQLGFSAPFSLRLLGAWGENQLAPMFLVHGERRILKDRLGTENMHLQMHPEAVKVISRAHSIKKGGQFLWMIHLNHAFLARLCTMVVEISALNPQVPEPLGHPQFSRRMGKKVRAAHLVLRGEIGGKDHFITKVNGTPILYQNSKGVPVA